jgi:hypothetical protein
MRRHTPPFFSYPPRACGDDPIRNLTKPILGFVPRACGDDSNTSKQYVTITKLAIAEIICPSPIGTGAHHRAWRPAAGEPMRVYRFADAPRHRLIPLARLRALGRAVSRGPELGGDARQRRRRRPGALLPGNLCRLPNRCGSFRRARFASHRPSEQQCLDRIWVSATTGAVSSVSANRPSAGSALDEKMHSAVSHRLGRREARRSCRHVEQRYRVVPTEAVSDRADYRRLCLCIQRDHWINGDPDGPRVVCLIKAPRT